MNVGPVLQCPDCSCQVSVITWAAILRPTNRHTGSRHQIELGRTGPGLGQLLHELYHGCVQLTPAPRFHGRQSGDRLRLPDCDHCPPLGCLRTERLRHS